MDKSSKLTTANILVLVLALSIIAVSSTFSARQASAQTSSSSPISSAKMHLDEGIKALQSGDTKGALMHLNVANQVLGNVGQ
ncbi:MAG TPA: hypothetical protein VFI70_04765 [Nitrososphaeraceae archaeon]|nr:hypothetical protein [Nitrososphaeraceae archaeon]